MLDQALQSLYQENIIDHAEHPRNRYAMENSTAHAKGDNPNCGDSGELYITFDNDQKVIKASFTGEGCAISQAGLSMLTELIKGKTLQELKSLMPGDIYAMLGIVITPARVNCALLSYNALEQLLIAYDLENKNT